MVVATTADGYKRTPAENKADPGGDGWDDQGRPVRKNGETQDAYMARLHEWIKHKADHIQVPGVSAVEQFLGALMQGQTWVRVGEVLVGGILLIIGLDHMFDLGMESKIAKIAPYVA